MYLDRILYPVTALGPGNRVALWVAGCKRKCNGCANPELWERHPEQAIQSEKVADYINTLRDRIIDGITITGGEPFDQALDIIKMIDAIEVPVEILAFSGYKLEDIQTDPAKNKLLGKLDVLIDGEYIDGLNDGISGLRGSVNQRIHYLNERVKSRYEQYISEGRKIQNFIYDYKTISVGIHKPDRK